MLKKLLKDHQLYMTEFQHDNFILGGCVSEYDAYLQSLRELYKRVRGLRETYWNTEKDKIELKKLKRDYENETDELEKEIKKIEIIKKEMQLEESERVVRNTQRELNSFYSRASELKERIGDLTEEKKAELEKERWEKKALKQAAVDMVATGRLSKLTYEMFLQMPDRIKLLGKLKNTEKLLDEFENQKEIFSEKKQLTINIEEIL